MEAVTEDERERGRLFGGICLLWGKGHGISMIGSHLSGDSRSNAAASFLAFSLEDNLFAEMAVTLSLRFLAFCLVNILNFQTDSSR